MDGQREVAGHHTSPTSYSSLATELKVEILRLVSWKSDQGNARLVSREWDRIMRPFMWSKFRTGFRGRLAQDIFDDSIKKHHCFHDIRELRVTQFAVNPGCDVLLKLLELLRDDHLLSFENYAKFAMVSTHLLCLLRHQRRLHSFIAPFDLYDIHRNEKWLSDREEHFENFLSSVKHLRLYFQAPSDSGEEHDNTRKVVETIYNRMLLSSIRRVENLELSGDVVDDGARRPPLTPLNEATGFVNTPRAFSSIRRLAFCDLSFHETSTDIFQFIDISSLESLQVKLCHYVEPLISILSKSIRKSGARLKYFGLLSVGLRNFDPITLETFCRELHDMLNSFTGLEELDMTFIQHDDLKWETILRRHTQSLRKLLLCPSWPIALDIKYTDSIRSILRHCKLIQQISIFPPDAGSMPSFDNRFQPFQIDDDFSKWLDAVATCKEIRILRLIFLPNYRLHDYNSGFRPSFESAFVVARCVFNYLRTRGSKIEVLAFSPLIRESDRGYRGPPHQYFTYRTVVVDGKEVIDASPCLGCPVVDPEATVLKLL